MTAWGNAELRRRLWDHQRDALDNIAGYLEAPEGSALIRMPTGSGKSGVIAVTAKVLKPQETVLVVTPRKALRRQLAEDVRDRFFARIGFDGLADMPVHELLPAGVEDVLAQVAGHHAVLVTTFQALTAIHTDRRHHYDALRALVSIVLVDEGHYEPGPRWSAAVRGLAKPTVLLTATPYRNDFRAFDVRTEFAYSYSYQRGVDDQHLRSVEFRELPDSQSVSDFVTSVLTFYDGEFRLTCPVEYETAKVIVRCQEFRTVEAVAAELETRGRSVVAVHEQFDNADANRLRDVPDPRSRDDTFWVHQYKLLEGLDDHRFSLLAIYEPFQNARALVQQVGRLIRCSEPRPETASVLASRRSGALAQWDGYLYYDKQDITDTIEASAEVANQVSRYQPALSYLLGEFRFPFDVDKINPHTDIALRRSAAIFTLGSEFSHAELTDNLTSSVDKGNRKELAYWELDPATRLHLWLIADDSDIVPSMAFLEPRLGYTLHHVDGELLFYADSEGSVARYVLEHCRHLGKKALKRLFNKGGTARLQTIGLVNSDLGRHSVRSKTIRAYDLAGSIAGLNDHTQIPSTVRGIRKHPERPRERYLGFKNGRVTDYTKRCSVDEYVQWLTDLKAELSKIAPATEALNRYAEPIQQPTLTTPRNILLDIDGLADHFVTAEPTFVSSGDRLEIEDLCVDVVGGQLSVTANARTFPAELDFEPRRDRYFLKSKELDRAFISASTSAGLVHTLNVEQAFRVVPEAAGYIYAYGEWYKPLLSEGGTGHTTWHDLLTLFQSDPVFGAASSEKGTKTRGKAGWQTGCLFDIIDRRARSQGFANLKPAWDILVCDDTGTEAADFIAADTTHKVAVFLHLKAFSRTRQRSATAFAEVCAQAVKNLDYLNPYNERKPPNFNRWTEPWSARPYVAGEVTRRVRTKQSPAVAWEGIRSVVRNPAATREVWVVLGNGFSLAQFRNRITGKALQPEDAQILFQIEATWAAVCATGARLRILCSP